jgi:hypothetical protein
MSPDQFQYILEYSLDLKQKERILKKLDIAEAINFAYLASQPKQKGKVHVGLRQYKKWIRRYYRILFPHQKVETLWDKMPKRKGRVKL